MYSTSVMIGMSAFFRMFLFIYVIIAFWFHCQENVRLQRQSVFRSSPVFDGLFDFCSMYTGASMECATKLNNEVMCVVFVSKVRILRLHV